MISVCMATYNGEKHIESQLRSILSQLSAGDEIVVSDGGSSDHTLDIITSFNDDRIKTFLLKESGSAEANSVFSKMEKIRRNFENALVQARGEIVFLADQDDLWHSNKVERMLKLLEKSDCVVHDCAVMNGEKVIFPSFLDFFKPGRTKLRMFVKSPFMGCCMAFNRNVLERALPFPDIHIEHDTWIGICAYKVGSVHIADEVLMNYYRHGQNASPIAENRTNSLSIKLLRRWYMLIAYLKY